MADTSLNIRITAADQASGVFSGLRSALSGLTSAFTAPIQGAASLGSAIGGLTTGFAKFGLAADGIKTALEVARGAISGLVSGNAQFETFETQFGVLLGSADAAKARLADLSKFAAVTPFELPEVVKADKVLTAFGLDAADTAQRFGVSAEQIRTTIGDVASGTGASFEEIATTFGRFASGATGEAIERFQELGIATREQMASWGLQFSGTGQLLTPAREAFTVLEAHVRERFGGMMLAQSTTFEGMTSNLSDWVGQARRQLTAPIFEPIKNSLAGLLEYLNGSSVSEAMTSFATGLGAVIEEWAPRVTAAFEIIGEGVGWLANAFGSGFNGILSIVSSVGQAIYDALSWINPFATHSPALVDQVADGVNSIVRSYRDLGEVSTPLDYAGQAVRDFAGMSKEAVQDMVRSNQDQLTAMQDALSAAKDSLNSWSSTPIEGTKEFEDRIFDLNQQINRAQLNVSNLKLSGASKESIQAATDEVTRLREEANKVKLEESLQFDPLKKQLQDLAKYGEGGSSSVEKPFDQIKRGMIEAKRNVDTLTPVVDQMKDLVKAQQQYASAMKETKAASGPGGLGAAIGGGASGVASGIADAQRAVGNVTQTVEDAKRKLDDWKAKVEQARASIERFFAPVTNAWESIFGKQTFKEQGDKLIDLGLQGGLVQQIQRTFEQSGLRGVGQMLYQKLVAEVESVDWGGIWSNLQTKGGEVADWLGQQIGSVDWAAVWQRAKDVGAWILNTGWDVVEDVAGWLGRQFDKIDWAVVWNAVQSIGRWVGENGWSIVSDVTAWLVKQWGRIDWPAVWAAVDNFAGKVADWLATVDWTQVGKDIGKFFGDAFHWAFNAVGDMLTGKDGANGGESGVVKLIKTIAKAIGELAIGLGEELVKGFVDGVGDLATKVGPAIEAQLRKLDVQMGPVHLTAGGWKLDLPGGSQIALTSGIPGFASGVTNFGGGWAMVGERGPELLNLPRGSSVYPSGTPMAGPGVDYDLMAAAIARGMAGMTFEADIGGQRTSVVLAARQRGLAVS